jgi:macrocin-O-methyltransferase TylF-like protien
LVRPLRQSRRLPRPARAQERKTAHGLTAGPGIYQGWRINFLYRTTEYLGLNRRIYGFDSFEGLSDPHPQHDQAFWKKGQYACSLEEVSKNTQAALRPRLKLVKGFFEKSLRSPEAQVAGKFSYVRIDCDIYLPALDCLNNLGPRLADGAILVFDDWPHLRGFGEQRAFEEWLPTVPHLKFEFLFYGAIGHFYTRVHHKK